MMFSRLTRLSRQVAVVLRAGFPIFPAFSVF
jgi:hypothetical protein